MNRLAYCISILSLTILTNTLSMEHAEAGKLKKETFYHTILNKINAICFKQGKSGEFSTIQIDNTNQYNNGDDNSEQTEQLMLELSPSFRFESQSQTLESLIQQVETSLANNNVTSLEEVFQFAKLDNNPELKDFISHCVNLHLVNSYLDIKEQRLMLHSLVTFFKNPVSVHKAKALYMKVPGIAIVRCPSCDLIPLANLPKNHPS